jgi:hypothetical protein
MRRIIPILGFAYLFAAACGGGSPLAPSSSSNASGAPEAPSGATISGTVEAGSSSLTAASAGAAISGLTVQVVGTNITAMIGAGGTFTLNGVPAGDVKLRFTGPGVDATLTITGVGTGETVTITVVVNGNTATLKTEKHENHGETRVNGIVQDFGQDASGFHFAIGSTLVRGDAHTEFFGDGNRPDTMADLSNGDRVEVKGEARQGFVYALRIHINDNSGADRDNDDGDEDADIEANGFISGLAGGCPSIAFGLGANATASPAQHVATSASTAFEKGACSSLKNGDRVEVKGTVAGSVLQARSVRRKS